MLRSFVILACLAVSVYANEDGAPKSACGDLTPQHGQPVQTSKPPYSISGPSHGGDDEKLTFTLKGDDFLGFMIQARDGQNRVVGRFNIVDAKHSKTLDCSKSKDTLTHVHAKNGPIRELIFDWIPPKGYKGNVKIMATVVQTATVYWVGRVTKDILIGQ